MYRVLESAQKVRKKLRTCKRKGYLAELRYIFMNRCPGIYKYAKGAPALSEIFG